MKKFTDIFRGVFVKRIGPFSIDDPFVKIASRKAAEVCRKFDLHEEAKTHLNNESTPEQFVERLVRSKFHADAVRFLAYALPKQEAVWWACKCVRCVPVCFGDETAIQALRAAEAWIRNPGEASRQAALRAGKKHSFEMPTAPAAWTAMAAAWSGGSTTTGDENVPAPPEHMTAHAASGAILLSATARSDQADKVHREFLEMGVQIAQGKIKISA